jgi:hypothetical protein
MTKPMDAILAIHNAFRRDMTVIDSASLASARGKPGLMPLVERFRFFNDVLVWHARGEELAIFPALEAVAPSVAEAYERDHRGLDAAFDALDPAVTAQNALDIAVPLPHSSSISTSTWVRRMRTCTALSANACPYPTWARLLG